MSNIIDATLRFVDKFTNPMTDAVSKMQNNSKKMQRMGADISKVGESISSTGAKMTLGLSAPIVAMGVASFNMASDMDESLNKVNETFGKSAKSVLKWSDTTLESLGLSKATALEMASLYGDMGTGMGQSAKNASKMSQNLVALSADMASFKNVSVETSSQALKGIYTGEGEALKSLGVIMTDATLSQYALSKGIKMKLSDMGQEEKVMLRYNYVMETTKKAQGDFARTSDGASNQARILSERIKEVATSMGAHLLPIGTKLLTMANDVVKKFGDMDESQQKTIIKILGLVVAIGPAIFMFGKLVSVIGAGMIMYGKLNSVMKGTTTVFKMLGTGGVAGLVVAGLVAIVVAGVLVYKNWDKIVAFAKKLGENLKKVFKNAGIDVDKFSKLVTKMKDNVKIVVGNLKVIFGQIVKFMTPIIIFLKNVFVAGFKVYMSAVMGYVSGFLNGAIDVVDGVIKTFTGITTFISGVFTGDWAKAWQGVKDIFGGIFESLTGLVKTPFNAIIGMVNGVIGAINKLNLTVPDFVPGIGGQSVGFNIGTIPMLAKGTSNWGGGLAITQDDGPEIMDLPKGTRVYPREKSIKKAYADGKSKGGKSYVISKIADTINVRNEADIDSIVDKLVTKLKQIEDNSDGGVFA